MNQISPEQQSKYVRYLTFNGKQYVACIKLASFWREYDFSVVFREVDTGVKVYELDYRGSAVDALDHACQVFVEEGPENWSVRI